VFIGDKDLKRVDDIDKWNRRILAILCNGLLRIDYHDEIIRLAFEVDLGLLHPLSLSIHQVAEKCGVAGMGVEGRGSTCPSPRGMLF
jgi:hypothetical protein